MSSLPGIMPIIQKAIDAKLDSITFTDIIVGTITNTEPVEILIDERFVIGEKFLDFSSVMLDSNVSPSSPQFTFDVGDNVFIIRYNKGQRFYVLDYVYRR